MREGLPDRTEMRRFGRSVARLARTRYPSFLFGRSVTAGEIPVFTYHEVETAELESDLVFLARNGYRTLSLDEYHDRMRGGRRARAERCVLLSFDDARRNFWEVALPVLRRHQARAALFVPTFWIGEQHAERPGSTPPGFLTWEQLADCERDPLLDVESHAHRHALVFTSERLAGFVTPAALANHDLFDWPMRRASGQDLCGRPAIGTPIYESLPLLSATERVIEAELPGVACRSLVETEGGEAFFAQPGALAKLRATHAAVANRMPVERVSSSDFGREIESELAAAVESFVGGLGRRPRYFAYPWMLGNGASLAALADLGFTAAFGVAMDFRRIRSENAPLAVYGRYKSDWLQFLPGEGRRRLIDVVPKKVAAFFTTQHFAH